MTACNRSGFSRGPFLASSSPHRLPNCSTWNKDLPLRLRSGPAIQAAASHTSTQCHPENPRVWGPDRTKCGWGKRGEGSAFRLFVNRRTSFEIVPRPSKVFHVEHFCGYPGTPVAIAENSDGLCSCASSHALPPGVIGDRSGSAAGGSGPVKKSAAARTVSATPAP